MTQDGRHIDIGDTKLFIVEKGQGYPVIILHGGPGLDHHSFGDYLTPLEADYRLIYVDQRSQGLSERTPSETWTLQQMAMDVHLLAVALKMETFAVFGHSYGSLVTQQYGVDYPGEASRLIISAAVPSSSYLMPHVEKSLAEFEPGYLREQVTESWANEPHAKTGEDVAQLLAAQLPFHFKDPLDPRIEDLHRQTKDSVYSAEVLAYVAEKGYGGFDVEDRLHTISVPCLILCGRFDRACAINACQTIAEKISDSQLVIFEESAHMFFVEEPELFLQAMRDFLG